MVRPSKNDTKVIGQSNLLSLKTGKNSHMKKIYIFTLLILFFILIFNFSEAQVSTGYTFGQAAGSPTLISGTYTTHTSGTTDYATYTNVPIGFTFQFNCNNYTAVSITNDGYFVMGTSISSTYTPLSTGSDNNVISAMAADLRGLGTGTLRSQTTGSSPNRKFTVEWAHYQKYGGTDDYTFQIVLTETSNTIQMFYTGTTLIAGNSFQVGLRGASSSDFNIRTKAGGTAWTGSTPGVANTDVMATGNSLAKSPNGIFTWTPVVCAGVPTAGTGAAAPASICGGENSVLSVTSGALGCGLTYQWQSGPTSTGAWTNISGATSATYTTSPSSSTWYRRVTTCTASGLSANSSSVQVTLGNCMVTGSGTSTGSYPYYGSYEDSRSQYIVTAAELTAAGICPNTTLNSLSFNASSKASTQAYSGFTIKIGHTSSSTFSSATWLTPAFTTVYSGNFTTAAGWNLHNFSTGFVWDGVNNIVIETCYNNNSYTSIDPTYYTSTAGNTVCYNYSDGATGCTMAASYTSTSRPNMKFAYTLGANCAGTPSGGTSLASPSTICVGSSTLLSISGQTLACGITYQWQSSPNPITVWTNIAGATSGTYTASPIVNTNYRCVVSCSYSGLSDNSTSTLVSITTPTYATLPYLQSFEGPWLSICDTREAPDNSWLNTPKTGDPSWRRNDDGASFWTSTSGSYSPVFTAGAHSARFHAYNTYLTGALDLYVNCSPAGTKLLCFDYKLNASSSASMSVLLSTDGGATFPTTLGSLTTANWVNYSYTFSSTSSTCVIRFLADGDNGSYDIGLDNISLSLTGPPNCVTYTSPANGTAGITCGINSLINWSSNGPSCDPPTSYDVYFGTAPSPPFIANQAITQYNPGTLLPSTTYYWRIVPRNGSGAATCATVWSFSTGPTFYPAQSIPPITDGFETCTDWTIVNGAQPNIWINGTATAHTGTNSMYINNTGTANDYDINSASTVHFYKDIFFPTGNNDYYLKFYWKGMGESSSYDYLRVFLTPTTFTPVVGTEVSSTYELTPYVYNQSATWQYFSNPLPVACGGNETWRLIFSWDNDGGTGTQPPIAVDDIQITVLPRTGSTCSNPVNVTLPYTKTNETTNCLNDDYSNSSIASCGSSYESGNDKVYKVLVGAAGCVTVSLTNASSASIGFQVYNGCPDVGGSTCIFNSTTGASGGTLTTDINIPAAGYYYFIVDNWAAPTYVSYDISISSPGGNAPEDAVCGAIPLTLGIASSGDNTCTGAIGEPAKPACWTTGNMNTVWYRVTVPASQDVAIKTTAGSLFDTQIDVYSGNTCGSLTYINCNQDAPSCGTTYNNSYILVQGITTTYLYIRVDGANNTVGTFTILAIDGNNGSPVMPPIIGQDCGPVLTYTNPVCGQTTFTDNPGFFAYGNLCDFTGSSICLSSGERSSVWYTINCNAAGNLTFDLVPNDYGNPNPLTGQVNPAWTTPGDETDYDWAIWKWESACDGTGDAAFCCTEIAAGSTAATRCNYNSLGVTGLSPTGNTPAAYGAGYDAAYETQIAVASGDLYVLAVSNYSNDYVSGYTLQFGATSPIAYATPGSTLTWASSTSTAWNQPGNWGGCSAPTCALNAIVNSGGAQPIISANSSVKTLTINAGASLTINAGVTLTICGDFINNGNIIMSPTATLLFNNASIAQAISGSLTGTNKIGSLTITKTGSNLTLGNNIDIGGNFTTSNSTSIFDATNKVVKIAGNFNTADAATLTNCPNIEFNGTIPQTYNNSSGTLTFTNVIMNNSGGGMTLINTATSNLYINGILTLTNGIIYTSDPPLLVMNAGSSIPSPYGSTSSFVDGPMQKIGNTAFSFPVGDAFNRWMRIDIAPPSAVSTFQAQYFYTPYSSLTPMATPTPAPVLNNVSGTEYWIMDRVAGAGNAQVTLHWENATSSGINSCAALQGGDLVVAHWTGTAWENASNVIVGGITGSCTGSSAGTVSSNVNWNSFSPFTFGSKSSGVNPLPVELLSFTGKNIDEGNLLEWATSSETNNDFFTLERSKNGYTFETLDNIDGSGNSNELKKYQFADKHPFEGINYYRLKQTDFDGTVKYAPNLIAIEFAQPNEYIIYPNPASSEITIWTLLKEEVINISITDISGRQILSQNLINVSSNKNNSKAIDISSLSEGLYYLTIKDMNQKPISQKRFVKMK